MTARTHDLAAIATLAVAILLYSPTGPTLATVLVALLANQLGGITPDIDQPTAPFWRNLPEGHYAGKVFGRLLGGHRFLSHSLLGLALFAWLSNLLLHFLHPIMPHVDITLVWYAFLLGYVSHLVMDSLTKEGVPWLLPIPYKFGFPPLRRLRITTGKRMEMFVVFPVILLGTLWVFSAHYETYLALLHGIRH